MINKFALIALAALVSIDAPAAAATPPPAPHTWVTFAWQCPGQKRSFIEIEQEARGSAGYLTRVVGLTIAGRKIDPATVEGLNELANRRNYLRVVGGFCNYLAEDFAIDEFASGPKAAEAGRRGFSVAYPKSHPIAR